MSEAGPWTSSPFVDAIAPITATDDEIAPGARGRRDPAAAPGARVRHRRPVAAARRPAAGPAARSRCPQGGLTEEQLADGPRPRARGARPLPRRRLHPGAAADGRRPAAHHGVRGRRSRASPPTCRCSRRSSRAAARTGARRAGAATTSRPTSTSASSIIGAGMSGLLAAHRLQQAGIAVRGDREERRRRRHLAREHVSGMPGRQPEPQLQLLLRAAPRLAVPLLDAGGAARLLRRLRRGVRRPGPRPVRDRGARRDVVRHRSRVDGAGPRRPGGEEDDRRRRRHQRGRSAEPAVVSRHRGRRLVRRDRRSTRRAGTTTSTSPASASP